MFKLLFTVACFFCFLPASQALVRITNMNDFTFGTWSGAGGNLVLTDNICVFDNQSPANYRIRIRGNGSGNSYILSNGALTIPYTVDFRGSTGTFQALAPNSNVVFAVANGTSQICNGGTNASIRITISQASLRAAEAGSYSGVLTVLLNP